MQFADVSSRIQVGLRCRPPFEHELEWTYSPSLQFGAKVVHVAPGRHYSQRSFFFDHVWPPTTSQEALYREAVFPLVQHVLRGFHGTVLAYGQTGTGKSYTMGFLDPSLPPAQVGIIPRVFEQLFASIAREGPHVRTRITMSFLEIHMENVYDLLVPGSGVQDLPVRPTQDGAAFFVDGLQEYDVDSLEQAQGLVNVAMLNRKLASTARNWTSSRSHTLLTISLTRFDGLRSLHSRFSLVDLAGSERATSAQLPSDTSFAARERRKMRLNEAKFINSSLSALGNVVTALANDKPSVVQFRDSKLTKLLKGLLGGHHATLIIATVVSAAQNIAETMSTLKFAARCKKVPPVELEDITGRKTTSRKRDAATQTTMTMMEVDKSVREMYEKKEKQLHMLYREQIYQLRLALEKTQQPLEDHQSSNKDDKDVYDDDDACSVSTEGDGDEFRQCRFDTQMDKLTDAQRELFRSGGSLNDYEIVKPIGKGKFSVVYRAKRRRDDVLVALKKVNIFNLMDAKAREKTLKEVRLVQSVHHPNIIQYIDAFIGHDDELCIAFEWAEAGDLKRQIRKANEKNTRFEEPVIWKYFAQICAAIQHMHLHRIMHRDIKPANIFLTLAGVVKVGDLGLGRYLSENTMEAHSKVGTPLYMSPEVLRGDGYDWKCDVWSLGCILYELAMLRSPFKSEGLNLYGLFQKVSKGEYEPVSSVYSQELRSLVAQMLSLNANDRPTMEHLCEVANAQVNRPSSSSPSLGAIDKDSNNNTSSSSSLPETNNNNETAEAQPPPPSTNDATNAIVLMDLVYDKLLLLDYKMQPPLHRLYFASESRHRADQVCRSAGRDDANDSCVQFGHFLSIAEWLLQRLHVAADVRRGHEPPLQKAATVLVCCGHAGVDVGSISPPRLTSGFGSGVCALLGAMCDKVLASQKLPRYIMAPVEPDEVSQDDTGDSEWKEDDDLARECVGDAQNDLNAMARDDGDYDPPWRQDASVIESPEIDPNAWKAEIDKNMPKIRQTITDTRTPTHWSLHLEVFRLHGGMLATWEADRMKRLQAIVAEHAETIRTKERAMNAQCQTWREQYQRRKDRHVELANHIAALEVLRADMVETLESISAALATTQAQLKARSDGLTDTTMLTQIKHGLTAIRAEIAAMDTALAIQRHRHFHTSSAA
ncbi:unnamed protein product [Aphanomyces euteiches]